MIKLKRLLLATLLSTATLLGAAPFTDNFCNESSVTIPTTECEALEALWNSTGGENWTDQTGWGEDPDISTWVGIIMTEDNASVIEVSLRDNNLTGELPNELGNFDKLEAFVFADNSLSGVIPETLKDIPLLNYFSVENNQYSGVLPKLIGLSNLEGLILVGNNFTGSIPQEYNQLTKLKVLFLYRNHLSGAIPDLSTVPLEYFEIYFNNFTFKDIEPQISWISKIPELIYRNQYDINETGRIVYFDDILTIKPTLSINNNGHNKYTWIKGTDEDNVLSNERIYVKHGATIADEGYYNYEVNNTIVTQPVVYLQYTDLFLRSSGHPNSHPYNTGTSLYAKHNYKPTLTNTSPITLINEEVAYTYTSNITDEDMDDLNVITLPLPSWLTLTSDAGSFRLSGTPTYDDAGSYDINITVTDGKTPTYLNYMLTVAENVPSAFSELTGTFMHTVSSTSIRADDSLGLGYVNVETEDTLEFHLSCTQSNGAYLELTTAGVLSTGYYDPCKGTAKTSTLGDTSNYPDGSKALLLPDPNNNAMIMVEIPLNNTSITIGNN